MTSSDDTMTDTSSTDTSKVLDMATTPAPTISTRNNMATTTTNNSNTTTAYDSPTLASSVSSMYSPESFIKYSLFLVQSDNLFNEPERKGMLYQIYWSSMQFVSYLAKPRLAVGTTVLTQNPHMEDGWYLMPQDFAAWATQPGPLYYENDEYGNWSFRFAGFVGSYTASYTPGEGQQTKLQYCKIPPLNGLDSGFYLLLRWHFLRELSLSQNSIAQYASMIEARYQEYKISYLTKVNKENTSLSARHHVTGYSSGLSSGFRG